MGHKTTLLVRGGGDLASGVITGFINVVIRYWYWNVGSQVQSVERFLSEKLFSTEFPVWKV